MRGLKRALFIAGMVLCAGAASAADRPFSLDVALGDVSLNKVHMGWEQDFYDASFVTDLEKSGAIGRLYK